MEYGVKRVSVGGIIAAFLCLGVFLAGAPGAAHAETQWDIGVSGGNNGIDGFHLSVGNYYQVPQREVVVVHERGIDDDELPVVFFLARRAHVPPGAIVDLRMRGLSWMDITLHYGLGPEIYYVPVTVVEEYPHPRGHAWGYYKKHRRHEDWRRISLRDDDIIDQVNLKFMSDHYRCKPERVMRYRADGRKFAVIDRDFRKERHGKKDNFVDRGRREDYRYDGGGRGNGHGKDHGRGDKDWKENKHHGKG